MTEPVAAQDRMGDSRAHRKHHNLLDTGRGLTWWAPGAVAWWIDGPLRVAS